jgi:hypothetical protein
MFARGRSLVIFSPILFQGFGQPYIETHLFSIGSSHKVRLSGQQTFRRSQPDEIFRRFDFDFEMFVFCFDVIDRFPRSVRLPVANEYRIRFCDIIEKIIDGLFERFASHDLVREGAENKDRKQTVAENFHPVSLKRPG